MKKFKKVLNISIIILLLVCICLVLIKIFLESDIYSYYLLKGVHDIDNETVWIRKAEYFKSIACDIGEIFWPVFYILLVLIIIRILAFIIRLIQRKNNTNNTEDGSMCIDRIIKK